MRTNFSLFTLLLALILGTALLEASDASAQSQGSATNQATTSPEGQQDFKDKQSGASTTTKTADKNQPAEQSAAKGPDRPKEAGSPNPKPRNSAWCVIGITAGVIAFLLIFSAARAKATSISTLPTSFFFLLGVGYLVLLLLGGWFYTVDSAAATTHKMIGGLLPLAVPWFGALGAVTISLSGVFFYSDAGWDSRYNYWHIGRPLFGAVLGTVAFFMFILIITSAGTTPPIFSDSKQPKDFIIYYVLAFLVGYREETFRELIQRVTDLILKPGTASAGTPQIIFKLNGASLTTLHFVNIATGSPSKQTVQVVNSGNQALSAPVASLSSVANSPFTITSNALQSLKELLPGGTANLEITFLPTASGTFNASLEVKGSNLTNTVRLGIEGTSP